MERKCAALAVIFLALASSRVAVSVITLECDSLQQLCPNDDQPRMCECNSTGNFLTWRTSLSGGTVGTVATFAPSAIVGDNETINGFTGVLTERANGVSISTLTFNPSTVTNAGSGGVEVSCEGSSVITNNIVVTPAVVPGIRQFGAHSLSCDTTSNTYQTTLQWNDNDTGGPNVSILYYLVEVTSSPSGFVCPPEQCNVTASTTTITGLSCSTDYSFTVRAVNCIGTSDVSDTRTVTTPTIISPTISEAEPPCFEDDRIRVTLQTYTGGCYTVTHFSVSSNCNNTNVTVPGNMLMITLPATGVSIRDSCEVTVITVTDCGDSEPVTMITSGPCMTPTTPPTIPTMSSPSISMSTSDNPTTTSSTGPKTDSIGGAAGGAGGAAAAIGAAAIVMATIFVCIFCPCGCCMPCRRMCCGCCPEEKICYRWGSDDDYGEPTPHVEKQSVKETKEKDVETGQPSYPAGPMYQDPSTIQRQAAPSGDLYAQPEKPARHQKQKPAIEMPTYQDPNTIQRQAAPTGDLYAQPDKPSKQRPGPAPVYSQVEKPQAGGIEYADLSHSEAPPNARRPAPVADTFYAQVRESRP